MNSIISVNYLQFVISPILNGNFLILLVFASVMVTVFAVLPAIKKSKGYVERFKTGIILAIKVGLILGIWESADFIISNKYLHYRMHYLALHSTSSIINKCILVGFGTALFVITALPGVMLVLKFIHLNGRACYIITCGALPSLLIFIVGGYRLNKFYLPGFLEFKSMVGNVIWTFICLILLWAMGLLILKISQMRSGLPRVNYSIKSIVTALGVVAIINLASYIYLQYIKENRPNVILISIDTLRADHLSCYGYNRNTSPNIDRFAQDGVLFANAIAQSSWTLPSHMSIFTGLYVSSHGVTRTGSKLSDEHLTLAEVLKNAGYKTVAFTDGGYVSHLFGYQGFDVFDEGHFKQIGGVETMYNKAVSWLRKSQPKPFFLFLHTYQVHCPYDPPDVYDIYSDKSYSGIVQVSQNCSEYYDNIRHRMTMEDYHYVIDKYDGLIYYTDHYLGKLFKEVKDLDVYDSSVIILTSDHGENFLDHPEYNINHVELYDEVIKVPLIVRAPELQKNRIIGAQVESIDIMPTILELLSVTTPNTIDGDSFLELVLNDSDDKIFAYSENPARGYKAIRNNDWKLLSRSKNNYESLELFDLKNDPREAQNLFSNESEIVKSLYDQLQVWIDNQAKKSKLLTTDEIQLDDDLEEKLKALGYLN